MLTKKCEMICYNTIIVEKDINRFMLKKSIEYFMYTDIEAYNNVLFAKCAMITHMNFLSGCNDMNCRKVRAFQAILRHNPEQKIPKFTGVKP